MYPLFPPTQRLTVGFFLKNSVAHDYLLSGGHGHPLPLDINLSGAFEESKAKFELDVEIKRRWRWLHYGQVEARLGKTLAN